MSMPISPLGPLKVAVTVDDMLQFRGVPYAQGYDAMRVNKAFVETFRERGLSGIYQFSNTGPAEDDPGLLKVFDLWVENGHHIGNHTHHHASLNWVEPEQYIEGIEIADRYIGRWVEAAPRRCFRFCMDMWGDTPCKCEEVLRYLGQRHFTPVPVSAAFHDFGWQAAHLRLSRRGAADDLAVFRDKFVASAVHQLRVSAANARAVFGRDPVIIWLIHGTAIAAECLDRILGEFAASGVEFVSLDEAMADDVNNTVPPRVTPEFIFQIEKWALAKGVPVNDLHPLALTEIEALYPAPGEGQADLVQSFFAEIARGTGKPTPMFPLSPDQRLR